MITQNPNALPPLRILKAGFASVTYVTCGVEGTLLLIVQKGDQDASLSAAR